MKCALAVLVVFLIGLSASDAAVKQKNSDEGGLISLSGVRTAAQGAVTKAKEGAVTVRKNLSNVHDKGARKVLSTGQDGKKRLKKVTSDVAAKGTGAAKAAKGKATRAVKRASSAKETS